MKFITKLSLTFVLANFNASNLFAAIHIVAPTGVSNALNFTGTVATPATTTPGSTATTTATGVPTMYVGTAGDPSGCPSSTGLCDTCANASIGTAIGDASLVACNERQVTPSTILTFSYYSDSTAGIPTIADGLTGQTAPALGYSLVPINTPIKYTISWQTFWTAFGGIITGGNSFEGGYPTKLITTGDPTATGWFTATIRVGVSQTGTDLNGTSTTTTPTPTPSTGTTTPTTGEDYITVTLVYQHAYNQTTAGSTAVQSLNPGCTGTSATPVCYFTVSSGDQSAKLEKTDSPSGYPSFNAAAFAGIRLYYDPVSWAAINPKHSAGKYHRVLLTLPTGGTTSASTTATASAQLAPDSPLVPNLSNDQKYYFKMAAEDQAGNVGFWSTAAQDYGTSDATATSGVCRLNDTYGIRSQNAAGGFPYSDPNISGAPINIPDSQTCHIVKPGEIAAILAGQGINCFVATAAYGSSLSPHVQTFRNFRDVFLMKHKWGISFVQFYYQHSPKLAAFILRHENLRAATRLVLWPALGFAALSLKIGALNASLLFATLLLLPLLIFQTLRMRKSRK